MLHTRSSSKRYLFAYRDSRAVFSIVSTKDGHRAVTCSFTFIRCWPFSLTMTTYIPFQGVVSRLLLAPGCIYAFFALSLASVLNEDVSGPKSRSLVGLYYLHADMASVVQRGRQATGRDMRRQRLHSATVTAHEEPGRVGTRGGEPLKGLRPIFGKPWLLGIHPYALGKTDTAVWL